MEITLYSTFPPQVYHCLNFSHFDLNTIPYVEYNEVAFNRMRNGLTQIEIHYYPSHEEDYVIADLGEFDREAVTTVIACLERSGASFYNDILYKLGEATKDNGLTSNRAKQWFMKRL